MKRFQYGIGPARGICKSLRFRHTRHMRLSMCQIAKKSDDSRLRYRGLANKTILESMTGITTGDSASGPSVMPARLRGTHCRAISAKQSTLLVLESC